MSKAKEKELDEEGGRLDRTIGTSRAVYGGVKWRLSRFRTRAIRIAATAKMSVVRTYKALISSVLFVLGLVVLAVYIGIRAVVFGIFAVTYIPFGLTVHFLSRSVGLIGGSGVAIRTSTLVFGGASYYLISEAASAGWLGNAYLAFIATFAAVMLGILSLFTYRLNMRMGGIANTITDHTGFDTGVVENFGQLEGTSSRTRSRSSSRSRRKRSGRKQSGKPPGQLPDSRKPDPYKPEHKRKNSPDNRQSNTNTNANANSSNNAESGGSDQSEQTETDDDSEPSKAEALTQKYVRSPPDMTFDDVAGMNDLKERFHERIIKPLSDANRYREYGIGVQNGFLLYGPPGTGKTYMTRALAGELGVNYIDVAGSQVTSRWMNATAENIADVFDAARLNQPCLVFIDEIDALAPERGGADQHQNTDKTVNRILEEISKIEKEEAEVVVVGATNRKDKIDDAVLRAGRLGEHIEVPPPDAEARVAVLYTHLEDAPLADDVAALNPETDSTLAQHIGAETEGMTAADMERVATEAARAALHDDSPVRMEHIAAAIKEVRD